MFPVLNKNVGSQPFLPLFNISNYGVFNNELYIAVRVTLSNSKSGLNHDLNPTWFSHEQEITLNLSVSCDTRLEGRPS